MKRRHGNLRSRKRARRIAYSQRVECEKLEAWLTRIRETCAIMRRIDERAYHIFLTWTGRA